MGNMARTKVAAIPIPGIGPELIVKTVKAPPPDAPAAEAFAAGAAEPSEPAALDPALPEPERVPTVTLRDIARFFVKRITRERIIALALACVSLGTLFLVWYLGTKYRFEFYIRFKNVPTPAEVYRQAAQIGLSNKFLVNIAYSVRRILTGFLIAIAIGVPMGLLIGKYQRVGELLMPTVEILRPIPAIAWVPMSIMLWPNNEAAIVFITFIGAFFP